MAVVGEDNFTVTKFSGLFDTDAGSVEWIDDSQLAQATNVLLWKDGSLRKRFPTAQWTSLTAPAGTVPAVFFIGQLIVTSGLSMTVWSLYHNASATSTHFSTGTSSATTQISGLDGKIVWDCCQYNNKMYFACEDGIFEWTGGTTTVISMTGPPSIRRIIAYRDILFGIVGDKLYWSDPGTPNTWAPESIWLVGAGDGDSLVNMVIYGGNLVLCKSNSMWMMHFGSDMLPDNWYLRQLHQGLGCHGNKSLKLSDNLLYFMNREGCWVTDTVTFTQLHNMEWDDQAGSGSLSLDISDYTVSVYKDWIIFNSRSGFIRAFHKEDPKGFTALQFDFALWGDIREQLMPAPTQSQWLLSIGNTLNSFVPFGSGGSVPVSILSKSYDIERISHTKRIKYATVLVKGNQTSTSIYAWIRDEANVAAGVALPVATSFGTISSVKVPGPEFGRTFALSITDSGNREFGFYGFNLIGHLHRQQTKLTEAP